MRCGAGERAAVLMSPTQRTLAKLRADGWTAAVTERWNAYAKIRQDLFGFVDVLAVAAGRGALAVQCTSGPHVADRVLKIRDLPAVRAWLESPAKLEVWGWRKVGPRGKRKLWEVRRVMLGIADGRVVEAEVAVRVD